MRLFVFLSVPFVLLLSVLLLFGSERASTVQAQAVDGTTARQLFLPLIATSARKSGIHLGNRGTDWQDDFLARLRGTNEGEWPAAVVVLSDQLYTLTRSTTNLCRISTATVRSPTLYNYLTNAIIQTVVIIRITPSPGNFKDEVGANVITHTLLTGETPAGKDYCGSNQSRTYRDILDIAQEMDAIYKLNVNTHKWPKDRFYFEPANEPNKEWYWDRKPVTMTLLPNVDNKYAWIAMDEYFAALYDRAKELNDDLQILAPPMSQGIYGEHFGLGTCNPWVVVGGGQHSGVDFMKKTYGFDFDTINPNPVPKADGFSLHNYWKEGQETWDKQGGVSLDSVCDYENGGNHYKPPSDHLVQYLPDGIAVTMRMSGRPTFITEADLQSPCQNAANPIRSKEQLPDGSNYAYRVRDSLLRFVNQEFGAKYVIGWLLVNEYPSEAQVCQNGDQSYPNFEINWHEAYAENGIERLWFTLWWQAAQ